MSKKKSNGEGTIYKIMKNGKAYYRAQITIGLDINGNPKRKSFSGYVKSDVAKRMREAQLQVDRGLNILDSEIPFGDFFKMWIFTYKKNTVSPATFSKYEGFYRNKIVGTPIENIKLKDLSAIKLQKYFNESINSGSLSPNNAKQLLVRINSCLTFALQEEYIFKNVAKSITLPKVNSSKRTAYTKEEQEKIISYLTDDKKDIAIFLAFATGMRLGEILALYKSDIDFSKNKITVNKQYQNNYYIEEDLTRTRRYEITKPKTESSIRTLPIPKKAMDKISKMLNSDTALPFQSVLLFCDDFGRALERKILPRRLKQIEKELNIPHKGFHCIRHSYATRLFEEGVPPKTVQVLLGHSTMQPTMEIYTHVMETSEKIAEEKLNILFA